MLHALGLAPVAVFVFLLTSQFFTAWDGTVVSVAPPPVDDPAVLTVRIVGADREVTLQDWPAEVVRSLEVPFDRVAVPPPTLPEGRPTSRKAAFALSYAITWPAAGEATPRTLELPTTSPRAVGIAALVFLALIALRNMLWAGSPLALERRGVYLPPAQAQAGVPVQGNGPTKPKRRGRKGPPPSRRGRRR